MSGVKPLFSKIASRSVLALVSGMFFGAMVHSASAQQVTESHIQQAKRVIAETGSTNRLDNILPQIAQSTKASVIRNLPDKEAILTDIVDTETLALASRRGDLETAVVSIFTRMFSEQELTSIADFFATEAGKKFLQQSPVIAREIQNASSVWSGGINRDLNTAVSERMKEVGLQ